MPGIPAFDDHVRSPGRLTAHIDPTATSADVRLPRQFVMAVIDGIGWKNRISDLRRIFTLWENHQIDGMYSLANIHRFRIREDLEQAARLRGLL